MMSKVTSIIIIEVIPVNTSVFKAFREEVLEIEHPIPWEGHLSFMKTLMRIDKRFYI